MFVDFIIQKAKQIFPSHYFRETKLESSFLGVIDKVHMLLVAIQWQSISSYYAGIPFGSVNLLYGVDEHESKVKLFSAFSYTCDV